MSINQTVKDVIVDALTNEAVKKSISLNVSDVGKVAAPVVKEMTAIVEHATNTEPWYQSRVTWGAIGAIALPILGVVGVSTDIMSSDQFVALGVAAGTVVSGLLTLYGRWVATKPIGK